MWITVEKALLPDRQLQIRLLDVGRCGWSIDLKLERKQSDISCFQHKSASVYFNGCGKSTAAWIFLLPAVDFFWMRHLGRFGSSIDLKLGRKQPVLSHFQHNSVSIFVNGCGKGTASFIFFLLPLSYRYFSRTRMRHRGWFGWSIDLKLWRKQSVSSYF